MSSFFSTVDKIHKILQSVPPSMKGYAAAAAFGSLIGYQEFRLRQKTQEFKYENSILLNRIEALEREDQVFKSIMIDVQSSQKHVEKQLAEFEKFRPIFEKLKALGKTLVPSTPPLLLPPNFCKDYCAGLVGTPKEASETPAKSACDDPKHKEQEKFMDGISSCNGMAAIYDYVMKFKFLWARAEPKQTEVEGATPEDN